MALGSLFQLSDFSRELLHMCGCFSQITWNSFKHQNFYILAILIVNLSEVCYVNYCLFSRRILDTDLAVFWSCSIIFKNIIYCPILDSSPGESLWVFTSVYFYNVTCLLSLLFPASHLLWLVNQISNLVSIIFNMRLIFNTRLSTLWMRIKLSMQSQFWPLSYIFVLTSKLLPIVSSSFKKWIKTFAICYYILGTPEADRTGLLAGLYVWFSHS